MKQLKFFVAVRPYLPLVMVMFSAMIAVAAYSQALHYPFISDDTDYVFKNVKLGSLHFSELWHLFVEPYSPHFEFLPLRELSYWLEMTIFGLNPAIFRLDNIALYLLCLPFVYATTLALWCYFRPLDMASAPWVAAIVTSLFALHPALVESVVWVSGRKYILPNLFSMLALWCAIHAKREYGLSALYATATLVSFIAVMFSKSSYVAVAPIIALLWVIFWFDTPALRRQWGMLLWPLIIMLVAVGLLVIFIIKNAGFDSAPFYFGMAAVARTLAILGGLIRLTVTLENRHFFYPLFEDPYFNVMMIAGGLAGILVGTVIFLRKRSLEGFAVIAFLLLCIPYLQLMPSRPPALIADRYVALAIWPAMLLVVSLIWRLKFLLRIFLLITIALLWCYQTVQRPRDWQTSDILMERDIESFPRYYLPIYQKITRDQLPKSLFREARETAHHIDDPVARDMMVEIVDVANSMHEAAKSGDSRDVLIRFHNLELLLGQPIEQDKWNPPMIHFEKDCKGSFALEWQYLVKSFPNDMLLRYNAGLSLFSLHMYEDAIVYLRSALDSHDLPAMLRGSAYAKLGDALLETGNSVQSEKWLHLALEQSPPDYQAYCTLAKVYKQIGKPAEVVQAEVNCRNAVLYRR